MRGSNTHGEWLHVYTFLPYLQRGTTSSFLELTSVEKGVRNKSSRVAFPESVPISLKEK